MEKVNKIKNLFVKHKLLLVIITNIICVLLGGFMVYNYLLLPQIELKGSKKIFIDYKEEYIEKGGKLGRKEGSIKSKEQKAEEYKQVIKELKRGTSVRKTAKLCDVSISTVQRIKAEFGL